MATRPVFERGPCAVTLLVHDPAVLAYSGVMTRGSAVQIADPSAPSEHGYRIDVDGDGVVTLSLVDAGDFPGGGDTWSLTVTPVAGLAAGASLADVTSYGISDAWSLTPYADGVANAAFVIADGAWSPDPYTLDASTSVGATLVWGGA